MSNIIKIKDVTKKFNDKIIFEKLNLEIEKNKITTIKAKSGFGKTTLARIIAGIDNEYEGKVELSSGIEKKDIVLMFQEDRLIENVSVYKNLKLVKNNRDLILDYLIDFEIESKMDTLVSKLSGGMKRRVALIRSLLLDKKVVILDEPFNGLDSKIKEKIINTIKDIQKKKKITMVVITHNEIDAKNISDTIIELDNLVK